MPLRRQPMALLGLLIILLYAAVAVAAPALAPHGVRDVDLLNRFRPPGTPGFPLGTDHLGQDLLSRILYGARISITLGFLSVTVSALVGGMLGALAGYFGGLIDYLLSRLADLLMAVPYLLFAVFAMAVLGPGFGNLIIALTIKAWVEFFRLTRGEVLNQKTRDYVEAARAIGRTPGAIIVTEILPNIIHSLLVLATLRMGYMIILEASLSFLGLGVPPDVPAWGSMVATGKGYLTNAWWTSTFPGLAILMLVLSINLFGEGLRDALDPRLRAL